MPILSFTVRSLRRRRCPRPWLLVLTLALTVVPWTEAAGPQQSVGRMQVTIWGNIVSGTTAPRQPITVTLLAETGDVRASATTVGLTSGAFDVDLRDPLGRSVAIRPTDAVEVVQVSGDPFLVRVPNLSAQADLVADAIIGRGPAGKDIAVSVEYEADGDTGNRTSLSTRTDANGDFRADFAGRRELLRGMGGKLAMLDGRVEFVTGWAAPRLAVDLAASVPDYYMVQVNVPAGQTARLRMLDPAGKLLLEGSRVAGFPFGPGACCMDTLTLPLRGPDGATVLPRAGDSVEGRVGEERVSMIIDPLVATVFAAEDRISGRTRPGAAVTIDVWRNPVFGAAGRHSAQVTTDADGRFEQRLAGTFDVRYNDLVLLTADFDGHVLRQPGAVPGLTFYLDDGTIAGALAPDALVSVTLSDGGGVRGTATAQAGADGRFLVSPLDASGAPARPAAGDRVMLRALDGLAADQISAEVPELTLNLDRGNATVTGRANPGGELALQAMRSELRLGDSGGFARPTVQPDGSYAARLDPLRTLGRGNVVEARYRTTEDHMAYIRRVVPVAKVEHGGSTVCGYASSGSAVVATLLDRGGQELARATGFAAPNLRYELVLRDPQGQSAVSRAGQAVRLQAGADSLTVDLPAARAELDLLTGAVQGEGPPAMRFAVIDPTDRCFYRDSPGRDSGRNLGGGMVDASGQFRRVYGSVMRPGEGLQVTFFDAEDNAFYLTTYRLQGRVFVGSPRVAGRMSPGSPVVAKLLGPDLALRATGSTTAAADGRFELSLADGTGQAVRSAAGDTMHLEAGGQQADIRVESLDFDFSTSSGVSGRAPALASVRLDLETAGARLSYERTADVAGHFTFRPEDVPVRAGWTLDDVRLVRVTLPTSNGHELVVEATVSTNPVPTPTVPQSTGTAPARTATTTPRPSATATRDPAAPTPAVKWRAFLPWTKRSGR